MNIREYHQLQAELSALVKLLNELPDSRVIERLGFEYQKEEIENALASQTLPPREPVHVTLTFRGNPVVGSHGVFAEFGAAAVKTFVDAISAIGASQGHSLGTRGANSNRADCQLLITGTALGSFGFELEEAAKDSEVLFAEPSLVEPAIEQTKAIIEASLGSDDELAAAISGVDPPALERLCTFLKTMLNEEAVCTLDFKDQAFRFSNVEQVRQSFERLNQNNVQEDEQQIRGAFQGVLPISRKFEFMIASTGETINGKVGRSISDASTINRILDRTTTIGVKVTLNGNRGAKKYELLRFAASPEQEQLPRMSDSSPEPAMDDARPPVVGPGRE
jgi:hypothetical protein